MNFETETKLWPKLVDSAAWTPHRAGWGMGADVVVINVKKLNSL